ASDARDREAAGAANRLREAEERTEQEYRQRQKRADEQVAEAGAPGPRPVTFAVVVMAVLVTMTTTTYQDGKMGNPDIVLTQELLISTRPNEWPALSQVANGQVWRLVTPMFLHFSLFHIVFNV